MSDPTSNRFSDLATALAPAVRTPGFDDVHRVARKRRHTRTAITVAAVVVGVAFAASLPAITHLRAGDLPSQTPAGSAGDPYVGPGRSTWFPDPETGYMQGLTFVSPSTAYRFRTSCAAGAVTCDFILEVTDDGGRSWQRRPAPVPALPPNADRNNPLITLLGTRALLLTLGDMYQLSTDGGSHWTKQAAPKSTKSVSSSRLLDLSCPGASCENPRVVALDTKTWAAAPLRNQPPLPAMAGSTRVGADRSVWIAGRDRDGRAAVSVTRDGGRSWLTRTLPGAEPKPDQMHVVNLGMDVATRNGKTAYAIESGSRDPQIYRTADGGRTWQLLSAPRGFRPAEDVATTVLPDGRLVVTRVGWHETLASSDGVTFSKLVDVPMMDSFTSFPGGVFGQLTPTDVKAIPEMSVTTDGRTWQRQPWPAGG